MHTGLGQKSSLRWNWQEHCLPHQQSHISPWTSIMDTNYCFRACTSPPAHCPWVTYPFFDHCLRMREAPKMRCTAHCQSGAYDSYKRQQFHFLLTLLLIILLLLHPENQDVQEMICISEFNMQSATAHLLVYACKGVNKPSIPWPAPHGK